MRHRAHVIRAVRRGTLPALFAFSAMLACEEHAPTEPADSDPVPTLDVIVSDARVSPLQAAGTTASAAATYAYVSLPPGSVMIFSHATADLVADPDESRAVVSTYTASGVNLTVRSRDRVREFFTGWDLVDPGVAPVTEWRPDGNPEDAALTPAQAGAFGGVALKP